MLLPLVLQLAGIARLPVLVKGVLRDDDTRMALGPQPNLVALREFAERASDLILADTK